MKYVGQADSPCIVPTSSSNFICNESKRSSYRVNRPRGDKKSRDDSIPTEETNSKAENSKFKPLNSTGNLVGMYLRQIGKSIVTPSEKESTSSCLQGSKNSYSVNNDVEPKNKTTNSTSAVVPLRRTKISPTKESPSKSAFTCDATESNSIEDCKKNKKPKATEPAATRKNSNKRRHRRRGKSDLGYVESFSFDDANPTKVEEKKDNNKEEEGDDSKYIENELLLEASSDSFDVYDDYYKNSSVERQDSFGSDSAVGTMKSDFFADIDLAKIRDGSSAILQELCRTPEKSSGTPNRAASPFESTAL